ncbi:MAG: HlyC/CorC family transporter [Bacteroidales bacterium]|nr:HlyC/CorC family transporter [Bacteroidales bacterium]
MESIFVILVSLVFSAFFSGMEIAYVSSNKLQIEINKKNENFKASLFELFTNNDALYIATMLIGNNIALVIYGISMGEALKPIISLISQSEISILLIQTIISTLIILITAEFLPKTVFRNNANKAIDFFAIPVAAFIIFFYPIAKITILGSNIILRFLFKVNLNDKNHRVVFGKVDLNHFVEQINKQETPEDNIDNEIKIFQNALDFSNIKIRECMIPRTELEAIEINKSIEDLKEKFTTSRYSRILIYEESIDNIVGYFHHSELFKKPRTISEKLKNLIIVPETMNAKKMLNKFIQQHKSMALVVDEFGGTSGIVTMEDIVEEIFGEIEDEHDLQEFIEKQINETSFLFSARLEIDYINTKYGIKLPVSSDYETIAGFIVVNLGYIPLQGETHKIDQFFVKIKEASSSRIELIELSF